MESVVNQSTASFYKGKKIFVTGHTGFKGTWFMAWLHVLGATIKGYALPPQAGNNFFNTIAASIEIENIFADIRDKEKLNAEILNFKPDFIFHFAAQALVRRSYAIPAETFEVNAVGTANLLEAVNNLPGKCTIIIITTDKVYENKEINYHYKESDILGGYDPYSASKAATEIVVNSFRNSFFNTKKITVHQKAIASARAGNVIGGGDSSADRIIPDIIRCLENNHPVEIRNPAAVRPWQHVLEPLSGYLIAARLLDADAIKFSGAYNFGPLPNDHLPVKKLVEAAIHYWGKGSWVDKSDAAQPHEAGLLQLDITKAKNILQWHPKLDSATAIEWTIDWYRQQSQNVFDFTLQQIKNYQQK